MNLKEVVKEHIKKIELYEQEITCDNSREILSEIYKYLKSITDVYYVNNRMSNYYKELCYLVKDIEDNFVYRDKILNVESAIDLSCRFDKKDNVIDYIVCSTVKYLIEEFSCVLDFSNIKVEKLDFTNCCFTASRYVKFLCDKLKIENYVVPIFPGYNSSAKLFNGTGCHFANVIKHENRYYLVDVTYSQFFNSGKNILDKIGAVNLQQGNVGTFILMTENGKQFATKLLENGYVELDEEKFKLYMDAFTMSFRNGLYYENTSDFSFTTPYLTEDYVKFLKGADNQIIHEGRRNLGYQKRPLKNYNIDFSKK